MALNVYAMLCGSSAAPVATAGRYEAEEAWLDHVALEAQYAGFSGFGYVSAFAEADQAVSFYVQVPAAGAYRINWSYAAAAGDATRSVLVDDVEVAASQVFPSTGAGDSWATVGTTVTLPAGPSLVTLRYAQGGAAPLNLDRIDLVAP
jgi:hypothetical protein